MTASPWVAAERRGVSRPPVLRLPAHGWDEDSRTRPRARLWLAAGPYYLRDFGIPNSKRTRFALFNQQLPRDDGGLPLLAVLQPE